MYSGFLDDLLVNYKQTMASTSNRFSIAEAERLRQIGKFEEALKHYYVAIYLLPAHAKAKFEPALEEIFQSWIMQSPENASRAVKIFSQIAELYPRSVRMRKVFISALECMAPGQFVHTCIKVAENALLLSTNNDDSAQLRTIENNLAKQPFEKWHIAMMNDAMRQWRYEQAIRRTITRKGQQVIDIGCGAGMLSVLAARHSDYVTSIEENLSVCQIAEEVFIRNFVSGKITLVRNNSKNHNQLKKADVIICEQFDSALFGRGILETMLDAHRRLAAPGCRFVPSRATLFIRMFECQEIYEQHAKDFKGMRCRSKYVNIDVEGGVEAEVPYWPCSLIEYPDMNFLSEESMVVEADFTSAECIEALLNVKSSRCLTATQDGEAHGFVVHFVTDIHETPVVFQESSKYGESLEQAVFPFREPIKIKKDEQLHFTWSIFKSRIDIWPEYPLRVPRGIWNFVTKSRDELWRFKDQALFEAICKDLGDIKNFATLNLTPIIPMYDYLPPDNNPAGNEVDKVVMVMHRADGSADADASRRALDFLPILTTVNRIVPSTYRIIGRLFTSDRINFECRINQDNSLRIDMDPLKRYYRREYREIRLAARPDVQFCSEDFDIDELVFRRGMNTEPKWTNFTKRIAVQATHPVVDGVIYEYEILGLRDTVNRKVAAFLFDKRIENASKVNVVFSMYLGQVFLSRDTQQSEFPDDL